MKKKDIIIICGPTASGKSYLAYKFAKTYNACVINIDSRQIYSEIPIITASPSQSYQSEIECYLYNFLPITEEFSVTKYLQFAIEKIKEVSIQDKQIILVGGTGLYINSLLYGYSSIPDVSHDIRQHVRELHKKIGTLNLWKKLIQVDELATSKIKQNDSQRLIRAYEIFLQTGNSIFYYYNFPKDPILTEFNFKVLFLHPQREFLYLTCDIRLDKIFKSGAIEEIKLLQKKYGDTILNYSAGKSLGIKEILSYLNGEISWNEALYLAQIRTRQYAKRQITWFKNQIHNKVIFEYSSEQELYDTTIFDAIFTEK